MNNINFASIVVTYRCNAKCHMCNTWQYPSSPEQEIDVYTLEKLPRMDTVNITGGEPFIRTDIEEIIAVIRKKCKRLVISSNGYFTDRILSLFRKRQDIGIRISIEGLPKANDELRGIPDGFDRGIRTLIELSHMGIKDIGFGITVSDKNAKDMIELYHLAKMMKVEFATAAIHNSYYFHKYDNRFEHPEIAVEEFKRLICELLKSSRTKDWFRAYFNYGLINYIEGNPRLLPCEMGYESFFLDPYGEIRPCNVMEETMGNLKEKSFDEIWHGSEAEKMRDKVRNCKENCWMIGSVSQVMKKNIAIPIKWIIRTKFLRRDCLS
ncbi:MAG: radical SAM protein [Candidatus Margulisbacteria bacterium]|nr:radical SAM protein [Candidatus Margulisiibacteriota bacterium]